MKTLISLLLVLLSSAPAFANYAYQCPKLVGPLMIDTANDEVEVSVIKYTPAAEDKNPRNNPSGHGGRIFMGGGAGGFTLIRISSGAFTEAPHISYSILSHSFQGQITRSSGSCTLIQ